MKKEDKLKEEAEFWLTYINDLKMNRDEPFPERAMALLENALLKLKKFYYTNSKDKPFQGTNRSIH